MLKFSLLSLAGTIALTATCYAASDAAQSARDAARQYGAAVRNCDMAWAVDSMYPPLRRTYADQLSTRRPGSEAETARRIMGTQMETTEQARARMAANDRTLRARYAKMGRDMKASGVRIESFTVNAPFAEYIVTPPMAAITAVRRDTQGQVRAEDLQVSGDRSRIVILPTTLVIGMPSRHGITRVERRSHIFAVRDEVISDKGYARGTELNRWYFIDGNTDVNTLRTFFPDLPLHIKLPPAVNRRLP